MTTNYLSTESQQTLADASREALENVNWAYAQEIRELKKRLRLLEAQVEANNRAPVVVEPKVVLVSAPEAKRSAPVDLVPPPEVSTSKAAASVDPILEVQHDPESPVAVKPVEGGRKHKTNERYNKILALLQETNTPLKGTAIQKALGEATYQTIINSLNVLRGRNLIRQHHGQGWVLASVENVPTPAEVQHNPKDPIHDMPMWDQIVLTLGNASGPLACKPIAVACFGVCDPKSYANTYSVLKNMRARRLVQQDNDTKLWSLGVDGAGRLPEVQAKLAKIEQTRRAKLDQQQQERNHT
jgi:hypothetical protein